MKVRIGMRRGRLAMLCAATLAASLLPGMPAGAQVADPIEVTIEVTPNGVVNSTSGAAIIRGEIECSAPAELELYGNAEQQQGDTTRRGYDYKEFDCTGDPQLWTLAAEPSSGSFQKGLVDATVSYYVLADGTSEDIDATVRMQEVCNIVGTPEGEELRGFSGSDTICGLGGDDTINGRGGNDRLVGGPGADVVRGGDGKDILIGGPGEGVNRLVGGPGSDRCKRETRRDVLRSCETKI